MSAVCPTLITLVLWSVIEMEGVLEDIVGLIIEVVNCGVTRTQNMHINRIYRLLNRDIIQQC